MVSAKSLGYKPPKRRNPYMDEALKRRLSSSKSNRPTQTDDNNSESETEDYTSVEPEEVKRRKKVGY